MDVERGDREGARRRKPKTSASEPERLPTTELSKDDGKKIFAVATNAEIAESAATVERVLRLVFALGAVSCFALGVWFVFSSNYVPPPVPLAHLLANVLVLPGAGLMLASTATLCSQLCTAKCTCQRAHGATVTRALFLFAWGGSLGAFGVLRFWLDHPYTLGKCPCPAFHADVDGVCVSCPGWEEGVCEDEDCVCGRGVCSETTATCFCDPNWATAEANGTCAQCSDRAMDGEPGGACGRCSARFKSDSRGDCTLCRNGYTGPDCMVCGPNFAPRTDDEGVVILDPQTGAEICSPVRGCKDDGQPSDGGRVGTMCEAVPEHKRCGKHGDQGAKIKYTNNNLQTPFSFTTTGVQCFYNYECPSYNCKGVCGFSSPIAGALCQEDADCLSGEVGVCGSRTCGAEWLVGEDDCQCSRSGYLAPRCERCPGFNGVWSASVCGGRGTCAAKYVDEGLGYLTAYSGLECVCGKPPGVLGEFPRYVGDKCQRVVNADGVTVECAEGFFARDDCQKTCPVADEDSSAAWGGIGACEARGKCAWEDGADAPQCTCDQDLRVGGVGWFVGESCSLCQSSFYSENCQPCPGTARTTSCDHIKNNIFKILDNTQCFQSCVPGVSTCDDTKTGTGECL